MDLEDNKIEDIYEKTFHSIDVGSVIKGKVVAKMPDSIVVDIGYKSEGFIPLDEFSEEETIRVQLGDELEVYVAQLRDSDGFVSLSRKKAKRINAFKQLQEASKEDKAVKGKIIERVKGGFSVDILGLKAFMPGSQTDIKPLRDVDELIGTEALFRILKLNAKLTNIVVSRRKVLEEEKMKLRSETLKRLKEGAVLRGTVKNITDYGVFVDLGGVDGLLHISDISWGRISHPSEFFSVGDTIEVLVLKYEADTDKVTLGYKQKKQDPWINIEERYPVGTTVSGKIVNMTDYGAFLEVEEGVEGLIHISELDWGPKTKHPSKYLEIGDVVKARVIKVASSERRLSLSLKQLKPKPWELVAERYKVGQRITGKIKTITDFGAFVGLPEGIDALIHISDISWTKHIKHPSEILRKGQRIEAVILSMEPEKERTALGIKQLIEDPWTRDIPEKYHLGDEVMCKIIRITDYGIFVDINDEVEGLIYSSEAEVIDGKTLDDSYKISDVIKARIIKIEPKERKIGLSQKNVSKDSPQSEKIEAASQ